MAKMTTEMQEEERTQASSPADPSPIAPGQPHIGIVLLWYPLFTQPFIFREVEELAKIMPLKVYTLYGKNTRHLSVEMQNSHVERKTFGIRSLFPVCMELFRQIFTHPVRFWRMLKTSMFHKWPSLEVFGENLWAFIVGLSLGKQFREDGIDMVYAPWPRGTATAARTGAFLANIPFGIAARGDNLSPADPDLAPKFSDARLIRANNQADRERIEHFANGEAVGKTVLVYNSLSLGARPTDRSVRFCEPTLKLLAVGRFDVTKGFDILLKACAILKNRQIPFSLTLAGGGGKVMGLGSQTELILDLRKRLDLEKEVSLPGLVSHDELPKLLRSHDIFVAPCVIHKSGRRDGIPNTVIEAMTYGMPIITTNINALPEVINNDDTGILVPPGDPEALADAICLLRANPEKAARLGEKASELARELFDPKANAGRLQKMFMDAEG